MKGLKVFAIVLFVAILGITSVTAQSLKGMSLNGATGLYSIPSGRIGWERSSDFGLDIGYHLIADGDYTTHIPKLAMSLFKWVEISGAFDIQPEERGTDFIIGAKVQFPLKKTALALGGNFQAIDLGKTGKFEHGDYKAGQIYLAATYAGSFFDLPAETTVVLGKTFIEDNSNSNIDFGMGFDVVLFPKQFEGIVHWITDFANFSYSADAIGAISGARGVLNTGLRFDMSRIKALEKFKFAIDILMTDAFDTNRAFSFGVVFGIPIL